MAVSACRVASAVKRRDLSPGAAAILPPLGIQPMPSPHSSVRVRLTSRSSGPVATVVENVQASSAVTGPGYTTSRSWPFEVWLLSRRSPENVLVRVNGEGPVVPPQPTARHWVRIAPMARAGPSVHCSIWSETHFVTHLLRSTAHATDEERVLTRGQIRSGFPTRLHGKQLGVHHLPARARRRPVAQTLPE